MAYDIFFTWVTHHVEHYTLFYGDDVYDDDKDEDTYISWMQNKYRRYKVARKYAEFVHPQDRFMAGIGGTLKCAMHSNIFCHDCDYSGDDVWGEDMEYLRTFYIDTYLGDLSVAVMYLIKAIKLTRKGRNFMHIVFSDRILDAPIQVIILGLYMYCRRHAIFISNRMMQIIMKSQQHIMYYYLISCFKSTRHIKRHLPEWDEIIEGEHILTRSRYRTKSLFQIASPVIYDMNKVRYNYAIEEAEQRDYYACNDPDGDGYTWMMLHFTKGDQWK